MATEAWCPTCKRDVDIVELDRESQIPHNLFPRMCPICRREFTIDGYFDTVRIGEEP